MATSAVKSQQAHIKVIHKFVTLQARARLCSDTMPQDEGGSCLAGARTRQAATFQQLGARVFLRVLQLSGKTWQVANESLH